jgi:hypothetical protein
MASLVNAETKKKIYYHHHFGPTKLKTTMPLFHLRHYLLAALEHEEGEEADSADPISVYVQKTRCYQASAIK